VTIGRRAKDSQLTKRGKEEIKYSNFFLTINTNYRAKSDSDFDTFTRAYAEVLSEMFNKKKMGAIIRFLPPNEDDEWKRPYILKADAHTNLEEGTTVRGGRIHSHSLIEITHKSKIHINARAVKNMVYDKMKPYGVKGPYVHVQLVNEEQKKILSYMRKDEPIEEGAITEAALEQGVDKKKF